MGFKGSIQDLAFEIAKRTWLKRTVSAASLALTLGSTYHRFAVDPHQVQEQVEQASSASSLDGSSAADRAPSSIHGLSPGNTNFRSGDEVFLSGHSGENSGDSQTQENSNAPTAQAVTTEPNSVGTSVVNTRPQSDQFNAVRPANPSSNSNPDNSAVSGGAGASTPFQGGSTTTSNPMPTPSATLRSVALQNISLPATGPTPGVSAVSPQSGASVGGTSITITGTNFRSGDTVTLGGSTCQSVQVLSPTQITCVTSFHSVQSVNVVITDMDGFSAQLAFAYNYQPGNTVQAVSFAGGSKTGAYGEIQSTSFTQNTSVIFSP